MGAGATGGMQATQSSSVGGSMGGGGGGTGFSGGGMGGGASGLMNNSFTGKFKRIESILVNNYFFLLMSFRS